LGLNIKCNACDSAFRWYLAPYHENIIVTCPFCGAFILAVIEDFSPGAIENAWPGPGRARSENKRRFRI
jgi:hypothetical protein